LVVVLVPALLPVLAITALAFVISTCGIHFAVWSLWCSRGRDVLLVYSDSPHWGEFFATEIAPRLERRAVLLNRSAPRRSQARLARWAYGHWGGSREHCPLALVFRPLWRTRVFRFYQPFLEWKQGKLAALERTLTAFFEKVGQPPPLVPPPPGQR
jgi:hypothetical protein